MDLRKVLATLGILAFVWPAAFIVALVPLLVVYHHSELLAAHPPLAVLAVFILIFVCGSAATGVSIWLYRRAFREP